MNYLKEKILLDKNERKSASGITLVALVITVIVLLILAGISLNLIMGDGGILNKATNARKTTDISSAQEKVELLVAEYAYNYLQEKYVNGNGTFAQDKDAYIVGQLNTNASNNFEECVLAVNTTDKKVTLSKDGKTVTGTVQNGALSWASTESGNSSGGNHQQAVTLNIGDDVDYTTSLNGVTDYYDIFKRITFSTPLHFGSRTIGSTGFVIRNTSLMQPLMPKIERYATMLAHADISLVCELVNLRETDVIEAITENAAKSAKKQAERRYNGELNVLVNEGFAMLRHNFVPQKSQNENIRIWDLRSNILASYLEEIGIKKAQNKREREITQEVAADDPMLKLNISDMLEVRQEGWKVFNEKTGHNVEVSCNIDYLSEGSEVDINAEKTGEGSQAQGVL